MIRVGSSLVFVRSTVGLVPSCSAPRVQQGLFAFFFRVGGAGVILGYKADLLRLLAPEYLFSYARADEQESTLVSQGEINECAP